MFWVIFKKFIFSFPSLAKALEVYKPLLMCFKLVSQYWECLVRRYHKVRRYYRNCLTRSIEVFCEILRLFDEVVYPYISTLFRYIESSLYWKKFKYWGIVLWFLFLNFIDAYGFGGFLE